jgi:hypothetical protein
MNLSQKKQNEMIRLTAIQAYTGRQSDEFQGLTSGGVLEFFWRKCQHQFGDESTTLCPKGNKCPFAHTLQELKQGQRVEKMSMCLLCPSTEESVRAQTKPAVKKQNKKKKLKSTYKFCLHACENVYNKRTQTWNEAGHDACPYKETCKFAHSAFEHRFGTALEARMNPKKQELTHEAVVPAPEFAFDAEDAEDELGDLTEEVAECEPLPMPQFPLTITRTDSQGSTTKINGGTVGFMCLEHTDGTLGYLPQSPIVEVPLCSALTSLESLPSLSPSTSSEISDMDEQSDSGVSFYSEAYSRANSVEPERPIVPPTNSLTLLSPTGSYGYTGCYLPVPASPSPRQTPSPILQAAIPVACPPVLVPVPVPQMAVPMVPQGGVAAAAGACAPGAFMQAGLCPVTTQQQQFWQPMQQQTVQYVQQGLCIPGQFQEQMYATHVY